MGEYYVLRHHGIKGQKWGVMNGPPYPLGQGQKSAKEKRLSGGGKTSDASKDESDKKKRFQLTDKQKKALKIGIGVTAGVLAAYGAYRLHQYANSASMLNVNANLDSQLKRKIAESSDFDSAIRDDAAKINRGALGFGLLSGRNVNCSSCSMAYEMRRRGYDVIAGRTKEGRSEEQIANFFSNARFTTGYDNSVFGYSRRPSSDQLNALVSTLRSEGDGARGFIAGEYVCGGGHIFAYEVHKGKVYFVEPQAGRVYKDVKDAVGHMGFVKHMRTDTLSVRNGAAETLMNNDAFAIASELPNEAAVSALAVIPAGVAYAKALKPVDKAIDKASDKVAERIVGSKNGRVNTKSGGKVA